MVVSRLNPDHSYPERMGVEQHDQTAELDMVQLELNGIPLWIALGQGNTSIPTITSFPIYVISKIPVNTKEQQEQQDSDPDEPSVPVQIGVYELWATDVNRYRDDDDNSLDLSLLPDPPLLYSFANHAFLRQRQLDSDDLDDASDDPSDESSDDPSRLTKRQKQQKDDQQDDDQQEEKEQTQDHRYIPQLRQHLFVLVPLIKNTKTKPLVTETAAEAKLIRDKYHHHETHHWIQSFMKNPHYEIVNNEGNGDCFFATIRDAFQSIGQDTTVAALRGALADQMSDKTYLNYKEMYDMFQQEIQRIQLESRQIVAANKVIKEKNDRTFHTAEQLELAQEADRLKALNNELKAEMKVVKDNMKEFQFMKTIDSLDSLKSFVQTNEFWADAYTVSTMERLLNIKFILLSSHAYSQHAFDEVLLCGPEIDPIIETTGSFHPEYYVILDYSGTHYQLVGYKHHFLFLFTELPYDLKHMIIDKCMERQSGVFQYIPEFVQERMQNNSNNSNNSNNKRGGGRSKRKGRMSVDDVLMDDLEEAKLLNLYDDNVVLSFYHHSDNTKAPGKGSGERIPVYQIMEFLSLAKQPHWRQQLDDEWIQPFTINNHQWASVEHVAQACPYQQGHPAFYLLFALDSDTDLSKDVDMAKGAGSSKSGKYDKVLLRPKTVKRDPEADAIYVDQCRRKAREAKFMQHKDLQQILLQTNQAKLIHHVRGKPPRSANDWMILRDALSKLKVKE